MTGYLQMVADCAGALSAAWAELDLPLDFLAMAEIAYSLSAKRHQ